MNTQERSRAVVLALTAFAGLLFSGCAAPPRRPAVREGQADRAVVLGMPTVRTWGDSVSPQFLEELTESLRREQTYLATSGHTGPLPTAEFLAISGGGANGAFGAGLLWGWTASGDRPQFKAVTGISTGALIAPFAFLGPKYDAPLREVYTSITTKDILKQRSFLAALFDDALADNRPLWTLMKRYVDERMLKDIAAEYAKGRQLLIGTTNLDARRAVIWNIGAIASSSNPKALDLIHGVLIASAAIPAAFPPVPIDAEVDGKRYQEMHVDGGAMTQVFLYPPSFRVDQIARAAGVTRQRRLYIIRNARLDPDWAQVERRTLSIAGRAISSLIHTQGVGDLFQIFLNAQRDGIDYNLAFIPADFKAVPNEAFDRQYMNQLFDVGFKMARNGYPWAKAPPDYATP